MKIKYLYLPFAILLTLNLPQWGKAVYALMHGKDFYHGLGEWVGDWIRDQLYFSSIVPKGEEVFLMPRGRIQGYPPYATYFTLGCYAWTEHRWLSAYKPGGSKNAFPSSAKWSISLEPLPPPWKKVSSGRVSILYKKENIP